MRVRAAGVPQYRWDLEAMNPSSLTAGPSELSNPAESLCSPWRSVPVRGIEPYGVFLTICKAERQAKKTAFLDASSVGRVGRSTPFMVPAGLPSP